MIGRLYFAVVLGILVLGIIGLFLTVNLVADHYQEQGENQCKEDCNSLHMTYFRHEYIQYGDEDCWCRDGDETKQIW